MTHKALFCDNDKSLVETYTNVVPFSTNQSIHWFAAGRRKKDRAALLYRRRKKAALFAEVENFIAFLDSIRGVCLLRHFLH